MRISMIVAAAEDDAIGQAGRMPWHMPRDLRYFKSVTLGHTVLMGSNTFYSLPGGALPQRRNMVLSRSIEGLSEGIELYRTAEEAIEIARQSGETELFVIGGAQIFKLLLPIIERLYLTRIHHKFSAADTFFPHFDESEWKEISATFHEKDEKNPYDATDFVYDRVRDICIQNIEL